MDLDEQVLEARTQGLPFARIARELPLQGPGEAYRAFLRAFRRRPLLERARIRQQELARLEHLRTVMQNCANLTPDERQGRLQAIQRMRNEILAD